MIGDIAARDGKSHWEENAGTITGTALVNANEDIVKANVKKILAFSDMCKCEKCFNDVCAIVLNNSKPRYVTTYKGNLLCQIPQMSPESQEELTIKVAQAIKIVSETPQH